MLEQRPVNPVTKFIFCKTSTVSFCNKIVAGNVTAMMLLKNAIVTVKENVVINDKNKIFFEQNLE